MDSPGLYNRANLFQRRDSLELIEEYFPKLQWRLDGQDSVIDVGSGCGNVLFTLVHPHLPKNYKRLVFSDLNPNMVNFAQKTYNTFERVEYRVLDIGSEGSVKDDLQGQFDHLTSFFALHWPRNLRQSLKNIHKLLRPQNSDCVLLFLTSFDKILKIYAKMRESPKWLPYLRELEPLITPLEYSQNRYNDICGMLSDLGFSNYEVKLHDKEMTYETEQLFRDNMEAFNPFIYDVPENLLETFRNDFVQSARSLGCNNGRDNKFTVTYKIATVYATK
ncbi:juvenile hormone acid O-methyltransferase-like [Haematobia irritans]|uniref:juvenile hormone acid O-methyltransferase-like n=1 Tax=Haematobia irritans TaxID=7368 RepID=UPI003F50C168